MTLTGTREHFPPCIFRNLRFIVHRMMLESNAPFALFSLLASLLLLGPLLRPAR